MGLADALTPSAVRALVFAAFSASAVYSVCQLLGVSLLPARRARARAPPAAPLPALLAALADTHRAVAPRARHLQEALAHFRSEVVVRARSAAARAAAAGEYAALEQEARAEVQEAVAAAEARALAAHGLSRSDYDLAAAYYTEGPGRGQAEVLEACAALRRCAGRFFATKASLFAAMRASTERAGVAVCRELERLHDCGALLSAGARAARAGGPRALGEAVVLALLEARAELQSGTAEQVMLEELGMSMDEARQFVDLNFAQVRARLRRPSRARVWDAHAHCTLLSLSLSHTHSHTPPRTLRRTRSLCRRCSSSCRWGSSR